MEETTTYLLDRIRLSQQKHFLGIEPCAPRWQVLAGFGFRRLGLTIIRNILEQAEWKVVTHYEKIGEPSTILNNPLLRYPNTVVGISTITTTVPRAYELAKKIKQINPHILVLLGGFHPTAYPDEALDYADFVVRGEGEETIRELLCSSRPAEEIQGISYWQEGVKRHNPDRQLLEMLSYSAPLIEPGLCNEPVTPLLFGRGCPFKCNFCAVSHVMGSKMRVRPLKEVVTELKLVAKQDARRVFFVDDNFFGNLEQAVELLRLIVKEKIKLPIIIQMRADTRVSRNPEILGLMKKAGIFMVCVGIEFVDDASLKEISKGVNMEQTIEFVNTMCQWNFSFYAMFIFGSFQHRVDDALKIVNFMHRYLPSELLQLMFLTPLPGTRLYREVQKQIFDHNWANYDNNRVVWHHPHMPPKQQYQAMLSAYKTWYSPWNVGRIFLGKLLRGQWKALSLAPYFLKGIYHTIKEWEQLLSEDKVTGENQSSLFGHPNWWESQVVNFNLGEVKRLTFSYPNEEIVLVQDIKGEWRLEAPHFGVAKKEEISSLFDSLTSLCVLQGLQKAPQGDYADLKEPTLKISWHLEEGEQGSLLLGETTGSLRYAQQKGMEGMDAMQQQAMAQASGWLPYRGGATTH